MQVFCCIVIGPSGSYQLRAVSTMLIPLASASGSFIVCLVARVKRNDEFSVSHRNANSRLLKGSTLLDHLTGIQHDCFYVFVSVSKTVIYT